MRTPILAAASILLGLTGACSCQSGGENGGVPGGPDASNPGGGGSTVNDPDRPQVHKYKIVRTLAHDRSSYTQGLVIHKGRLYESTGRYQESTLREVDLDTGKATRRHDLAANLFGEGLTVWKGLLVQVTWKSGQAIVYDRRNLQELYRLDYEGEGWGLTHDGESLIMSDGTDVLRYLSPSDFSHQKDLKVTLQGRRLWDLNELEFIEGEIWANLYQKELIVRIDPETGAVRSLIDLSGLQRRQGVKDLTQDVLNGIAYDSEEKRLYITGKYWPNLYEIEVLD